jgi:hypothetical protein
MKSKTLDTCISIKYNDKGNIKSCKSIYDNDITNRPLNDTKGIKTQSKYIPLMVDDINNWFKKFRPIGFNTNL